jgi:hypothetical protein
VVDFCEGAPVAVSGWVLTDRHDLAHFAAISLHRETMLVNIVIGGEGKTYNVIGGTGKRRYSCIFFTFDRTISFQVLKLWRGKVRCLGGQVGCLREPGNVASTGCVQGQLVCLLPTIPYLESLFIEF